MKVPQWVLEEAEKVQKYNTKARDSAEKVEYWLRNNGVNTNLMRDKDTILPHLDYAEYDVSNFQSDLDEFIEYVQGGVKNNEL